MREKLNLFWFYNDECEYCTEMEPEVKQFAKSRDARFIPVHHGIVDESGEPQVPAIMFSDPKVENRIFLGRFALDALRWSLAQG